MSQKWVVVELSHLGEQRPPEEVAEFVRGYIGKDADIFIPAVTFYRKDSTMTICLMEGYFFIAASLPTATYFDLEGTSLIKRVLTRDEPAGRFICYVENHVVEDLKRRLKEQTSRSIEVGDYVLVLEGAYSKLKGRVLDVLPSDRATIHIMDLKSMEVIVELPFQFFMHTEESDYE